MQFVLNNGTTCSIDTIYGDRWGDVFWQLLQLLSGSWKVYRLPGGFPFWKSLFKPELIGMAYANNNLKTEFNRFKIILVILLKLKVG
jgi:hypothetical protein